MNFAHLFILLITLWEIPLRAETSVQLAPVDLEKLTEAQKKKCGKHIDIYRKNSIKSDCRRQNPELGTYSDALTRAFNASFKVCRETVEFEEAQKNRYQELITQGTREADTLANALKGQSLSQEALMRSENEQLRLQARNFQDRNKQIRVTFGKYRDVHDLLARIEKHYENMRNRLGQPNNAEGGLCPDGEQRWLSAQTGSLDQEITALRKHMAGSVQQLNSLYQRNLVAAGASKDQAVASARAMLNMQSASDAIPSLQGNHELFQQPGRNTTLREDGSLGGADQSVWQRIAGTSSPHEKEWAAVKCPDNSDSPACYDRLYKSRTPVDPQTLALFTGEDLLTERPTEEGKSPATAQDPSPQGPASCTVYLAMNPSETKCPMWNYPRPEVREEDTKTPTQAPRPDPNLASPAKLPGHENKRGVTNTGVNDFYRTTAGVRYNKDGVDDGFSDLYLQSRNSTYFQPQDGDLVYTGRSGKSGDVTALQRNINIVFASFSYDQRIKMDGQYGMETQSALDFIAQNPEMRAKLLERQSGGRAPASLTPRSR